MKILRLAPYFYPEQVSSSHLMDDLSEALSKAGVSQEVYVPMPTRGVSDALIKEYRGKKNEIMLDGSVSVHRFSMIRERKNPIQRAIRYLLVSVVQYLHGVRINNIDAVFSGSTPPTQGILCGKVAKKLSKRYGHKVPFIYNLQDVFPDSLVNANMTKKGSIIWKIGRKIENYTYRSADKIIVISEDFKRNIIEKGVQEDKIIIIPNWVNIDNVYPVARKDNVLFEKCHLDRDKFYICYSGNIGLSQNFDLLIETAKVLKDRFPDIRFVVIGDGAARDEFERSLCEHNLDNIILLPFQPYEDIANVFSLGDVGLIISKPGVGRSSVPSKTWSIMAAERPILASFDSDSELVRLISKTQTGLAVDAGNLDALVDAVVKLYTNKKLCIDCGRRGREYLMTELDKDKCVQTYVEEIKNSVISSQ